MADCNDTLRELYAFLDQELTDDASRAVLEHLEDCSDCYQAFDFHAELKAVIAAKCRDDEMPMSLIAKIELCFGELDDGQPVEADPGEAVTE
ncbi:MAG: anti-sigma factor [Actinomycetota bacterium]|jgi:mycothiol system anti-sigma-R factor